MITSLSPTVLYVGRMLPAENAHASDVVVFRHLAELVRRGWNVIVAIPGAFGLPERTAEGFQIISANKRRLWWPPMRFGWTSKTWNFIWATEVLSRLRGCRVDVVLSHLQGQSCIVARNISRRLRVPFGLFVHDDVVACMPNRDRALAARIISSAAHCWCVSRALDADVQKFGGRPSSVLLPVPSDLPAEGASGGSTSQARKWKGRIAVAGTLYAVPHTLSVLADAAAQFGFRLAVIASPTSSGVVPNLPHVERVPFFPTSKACAEYLSAECDAMVVPYPVCEADRESAGFLKGSFPSRLVEFSRCGVPIGIFAPSDYAISEWCAEYLPSASITSLDGLRAWFLQLTDEDARQRMSAEMHGASQGFFAPSRIHRQFVNELEDMRTNCRRGVRQTGAKARIGE